MSLTYEFSAEGEAGAGAHYNDTSRPLVKDERIGTGNKDRKLPTTPLATTNSLASLQTDEQVNILNTINSLRQCGLDGILSLPQIGSLRRSIIREKLSVGGYHRETVSAEGKSVYSICYRDYYAAFNHSVDLDSHHPRQGKA